MRRKCNCSGGCGSQPEDGVSRREFISILGAGAGAALLGSQAWTPAEAAQAAEELEKWKRTLHEPSPPRVYVSEAHKDARMHLGGIGTGNFEIGADGQLTTWQLFNTLRDGHVPLYFGVKAGGVAKLLQTAGGPDLPKAKRIEMKGEYPFAFLRFVDADLPIELDLTAFSPFAPLDTRLSSLPLACFVFRIRNGTGERQSVSLAAMMQNVVGYDATGDAPDIDYPNFGGNWNEPWREGKAAGLIFQSVPGKEPALDTPVVVYGSPNLRALSAPPRDRAANLKVETPDRLPDLAGSQEDLSRTVVWFEEPSPELPEAALRAARDAVQAGATLLISGKSVPLLQYYAQVTRGKPLKEASVRPDILFEDFEGDYGKWTVEGKAFGEKPASGTLPSQQQVSGFAGKGVVNTFLGGDDPKGKIVSKPFKVERNFIRFLIGGGAHETTQIRLVVGGKVVRAASGRDNEKLEPAAWDVGEFEGREAHLEIVDEQSGPWGHINIDHIQFSDLRGSRAMLEVLEDLLPATFRGVQPAPRSEKGGPGVLSFDGLSLLADAKESRAKNGLRLFVRPGGKGKVVLAAGEVLDPARAGLTGAREPAYVFLCELVGAAYSPSGGTSSKACGFGTLALGTLAESPTVLESFADWKEAWEAFARQGRFTSLEGAKPTVPTRPGRTVNGAVAATVDVPPGQVVEVPFFLAWHYPNKYAASGAWMGCHYATVWPDIRTVVKDAAENFAAFREKTERFHKAMYDSTLPYWLIDCLTSQASIIRHIGVVFRIANGDTYGWEGSNGCCQPTCTHVWGYEQTLSRLFPDLERDMRRIDFKHQQGQNGGVHNRTEVPSPPRPTGEQPFADGHSSCVLKAYREALNQDDDSWMKEYWPHIRKAVDYLIARDASTAGGEPAGILQDDQWNTYDEALHGVTTFISGYYLAALRAGEEWARRMGDTKTADRYRAVFEKGQKKLIEMCWEGEYFRQNLPDYEKRHGEVGPGCMSDQLIGQWWAHQLGLGYLFPKEKVVSSLKAVFKHNWKGDLTGWKHSPRAFAGAKDKGLIICTWPKGGRPGVVMLYSDVVWTGIEYQVAAHMIYEGMIDEAFAIVKGARDRYDGIPRPPIPRSPWNEIECGGHYARAMSSWSLLLAISGYEYDGPAKSLRFTPRCTPARFKAFFCGPSGWGSLQQERTGTSQKDVISVKEGSFQVASLHLEPPAGAKKATVRAGAAPIEATLQPEGDGVRVKLSSPITLNAGDSLEVQLG